MRATIPLFAALVLSSCARTPQQPFAGADGPRVTFQHATVDALRSGSIDARFDLAVHNPLPYDVDLASIAWTLDLADAQRLTGTTEEIDLDPREAATVTIPIHREWEQLAPALAAIGDADNIPFELTATAVFDTPEGRVEVPILAEGQLPVVMPPPEAQLVDVRELVGGELPSLQLRLRVEGFPHDATRLRYRIWLGYDMVTDGVTTATWDGDELALAVVVDQPGLAALREGEDMRVEITADVRTPYGVVPVVVNAGAAVTLADRQL